MARPRRTQAPDIEQDNSALQAGFDQFAAATTDELNDERIEELPTPPMIGGQGSLPGNAFGLPSEAQPVLGRATSPKLYAQAARFPNCQQLRVWKIENGVPVGLGPIGADATEEDLCRQFFATMPRGGEGKGIFKIRPLDINGNELGTESTTIIGEHHIALQGLRNAQAAAGGGNGINILGGLGGMSPEILRLFERIADSAEDRAKALERTLEGERERVRAEDVERARERIDLATNAATGVQSLTERMMQDESRRAEMGLRQQQELSERAARAAQEHGQVLLTTLTSIFNQSSTMQAQAEAARQRQDEYRLEQERLRAERELRDAEERRRRDGEEAQRRIEAERNAATALVERERAYLEQKSVREAAEMERKERIAREDADRKEKLTLADMDRRETRAREESERKEKYEREMTTSREAERQRQHERMLKEMDLATTQQREHAERMMTLSKQELGASTGMNIVDMIPKAANFLKTSFGIDAGDLLRTFLAPKEEGGGAWAEALPAVVSVVGEVLKEGIKARAAAQPGRIDQLPAFPMLPAGMPPRAQREPVETEELDEEAPAAPPAEAASPPGPATQAGLPLAVQKAARNALRGLVSRIRNTPPDKWFEQVAQALQAEGAIFHYVQATSVRFALIEAGAEADLAQRIIQAMQDSGLVPPDLNYG